jgi:beta-phosphoglucomutase-like phosphatase (HAD superfamily)
MKLQASATVIKAKAVVFDTDGTLIDTTKRFFTVFNRMLQKHGKKPLDWKNFYKRYCRDTLDDVVTPKKAKYRKEFLHRFWIEFLSEYRFIHADGDALIRGVDKVLKKIAEKGALIAITTSCIVPSNRLGRELSKYDIRKFANAIVTGADVVKALNEGHHFSKKEIFELAMKKLGVAPRDCVVVGDYWSDIKAGKELGAKTIAVLSGSMELDTFEKMKPDAIIDGVKDMLKVVNFEAPKVR